MGTNAKEYMDIVYKKILKGNKGELKWIVDFVRDNYRYTGRSKLKISFEEDMIVRVLRKLFVLLVESNIDNKYYPDIISDGYLYTLEKLHKYPDVRNRKNIASVVENYANSIFNRSVKELNRYNKYFSYSSICDNTVITGYENRIINSQLEHNIDILLDSIKDKRMIRLIHLIYGFDSKEHSMEECAKLFGVSKGRIGQMRNKALRMLRKPIRSKYIIDYMNEFEGINSCIHSYTVNSIIETSHSCDIPGMYMRKGIWSKTEDDLSKLVIKKPGIIHNNKVSTKKKLNTESTKNIFRSGTNGKIANACMKEVCNEKSSYYIKIEDSELNTYGFDIFGHIFENRPDLKEYFDKCLKELSHKYGSVFFGSNDELFMWCIFNDPLILFRKDQNEYCIFSEKEVIDIAYKIFITIPELDLPIYCKIKLISNYFCKMLYLAGEYYDLYSNSTSALCDLYFYDNLYFFFGHFYYIMLMLYRREKSFYDIRCEYLYSTYMYNNFPYDKIIGIYNRFVDIISNNNENLYINRQFPDKFKKLFSDNGIIYISDLMKFYSENDLVKFSRIRGISWEELNELNKIAINMNLIPNCEAK